MTWDKVRCPDCFLSLAECAKYDCPPIKRSTDNEQRPLPEVDPIVTNPLNVEPKRIIVSITGLWEAIVNLFKVKR